MPEFDPDIIDRETLRQNRKRAEAKVSQLTTDEYRQMRIRAKQDIFFLAYAILGYDRLTVNFHGDFANWMKQTEEEQFRLLLLPRGHYKSTLYTIADSIQIVLPNDDNGYQVWPRCIGTEGRLAIIHEVDTQAQAFLSAITDHFVSNPLLMGLFPECVPEPGKQVINKGALGLPRKSVWPEQTIQTFGVGARAQGKHFNYLKCDDLIGDKARDSRVEMQAAKDWVDNIQSFMSSFSKDHIDFTGTRWALDDLYSHVLDRYHGRIKTYIRSVEERNPDTGKLEAIFPEEFTPENLSILRKNPKIFSAQYLNDPANIGEGFEQEWLRYYEWESPVRIRYTDGIFNENTTVLTANLDKVIIIDPAVTGESGIVVTGTNNKGLNFVLEEIQEALKPPALTDLVFRKVQQYRPREVIVESVLFSELFAHWWPVEMAKRGIRFRIQQAKTRQKEKGSRIAGLANYFEKGLILFNRSHTKLLQQYASFGAMDPRELHCLDALAYGPEFWRSYTGSLDENAPPVSQTSRLHKLSGYSKV
jgi:predicted phage terminase large subunit-like protein